MAGVKAMAKSATRGPRSAANGFGVFIGFCGLGRSLPMHHLTIGFGISCLALLCLSSQVVAGGVVLAPAQTLSTGPDGVLTATNWGSGTTGINNPLDFNQFNPRLGVLTSIDITLTTNIRNDYVLTFTNSATIDVATSQTTDPSVLNDPAKRALLTDGPTVTLFGPNGVTQIFGAPGTRQPVDFVQLTESSGTFSSMLPITNPNYISPSITQQTFSRTLTATDSTSLFSDFIGTGMVDLPVSATANSSFFSSSGNGGGGVVTKANATVTVQFVYLAAVPEPSSVFLIGVGIGIVILASKLHRRAACLS